MYCSNRGICNFQTGYCACSTGFGGPACGNVTYVYSEGSNSLPGLQVNVNGLDYLSTAVQIRSTKPGADDFYLIDAVAGGSRVFSVRGDGAVGINALTLQGGLTINGGGLVVVTGGVTVSSVGMNVRSSASKSGGTVLSVTSTFSGALPSTFTVLQVSSVSLPTQSQHLLFGVRNQGSNRFTIRADGLTTIAKGGLSVVTGGISVSAGGIIATGGISVMTQGLSVTGGITIKSSGVIVQNSGITVVTGGLIVVAGGGQVISLKYLFQYLLA